MQSTCAEQLHDIHVQVRYKRFKLRIFFKTFVTFKMNVSYPINRYILWNLLPCKAFIGIMLPCKCVYLILAYSDCFRKQEGDFCSSNSRVGTKKLRVSRVNRQTPFSDLSAPLTTQILSRPVRLATEGKMFQFDTEGSLIPLPVQSCPSRIFISVNSRE